MTVSVEHVTEAEKVILSSLPEINQIEDSGLRKNVLLAWTMALKETSFSTLEDVGPEGLKTFTLTDHLRGVANMAVASANEAQKVITDTSINKDVLIAGALCHDIGIPFEEDPKNRESWQSKTGLSGHTALAVRHSAYGVHLILKAGLPLEIAHIAAAHSPEGQYLKRSLECAIVHRVDYLWWEIFSRTNMNSQMFWEKNMWNDRVFP